MTKGVIDNPYVVTATDYLSRAITVTFNWSPVNRSLSAARVDRDAGCLYQNVLIGLGPDGTPDTTVSALRSNGNGVVTLTPPQLAAINLNTIDDVVATQITFGL